MARQRWGLGATVLIEIMLASLMAQSMCDNVVGVYAREEVFGRRKVVGNKIWRWRWHATSEEAGGVGVQPDLVVKGWHSSVMTTMVIDGNGGACGC